MDIIADIVTIFGLIWAILYGIINKHKSVIGFKINEFTFSIFKIAIILFVGLFVYKGSEFVYGISLIISKGDANKFLWERGKELAHIISYIIAFGVGLFILWLEAIIIWTGSIRVIRNAFSSHVNINNEDDNKFKLIIEKALYKTNNSSFDVTSQLQNMVSNQSLTITASNKLAGDPDPGVTKVLEILYKFGNGKTNKIVITEGNTETLKYNSN